MPLNTSNVGQSTDFIEHTADDRWIMAYAAALGDLNPAYMDTTEGTICAHPVFPVCLEWPSILRTRNLLGPEMSDAESARGVHAAHDLHIYRPITAGALLRTRATLVGVRQMAPGAGYTLRLDTFDVDENLICRTYQFGIYRDVEVVGEPIISEAIPSLPADGPIVNEISVIPISAGAAHTYTECARIWNPIHTDSKVAQDAGLPDIILHGTATLALSVSHLVNHYVEGQLKRVRRLGGRFAGMVFMPSELTLHTSEIQQSDDGLSTISFEIKRADGKLAIESGFFSFL